MTPTQPAGNMPHASSATLRHECGNFRHAMCACGGVRLGLDAELVQSRGVLFSVADTDTLAAVFQPTVEVGKIFTAWFSRYTSCDFMCKLAVGEYILQTKSVVIHLITKNLVQVIRRVFDLESISRP